MNLKRLVPAAVVILISQTIQAQQTSLSGTISDSSGAVIAEAIVRATPAGGGAGLTVITSRTGAYQFPSLVAADYLIRIETPGFTPAERTVTLLVGQSLTMDVQLRPAQSASTIEVSAAGAEVSVTTSQVGGTVDPNRMKDVPLNGRNWLELSLLVPGITQNSVNSVPLGNSGGRFQLNLDGQQVSQNSAGATFGQPQYSRDAISQFQIITNRFDATLGRSSQIQVNAETKSGSNEFHGSAYGYFRHDSMNAADPISHTVLPFSDQQYGGTFGGTLIRDKLFFFAGYERERKPSTVYTIPLGFEPQSFTFATSYNSQSLLTRFDYQLSGGSRLSLRGSYSTDTTPFTGVGGNSHPSRANSQDRAGYSVLMTWTKVISSSTVNEIKGGYNHYDWLRLPLVESQEYRFAGNSIGGPYNYPQNFNMDTISLRDDFFLLKGTHSLKAGAEYLQTWHTGIFQQNIRGTVLSFTSTPSNLASIFPVWNDPKTWNLAALGPISQSYVQGFGNFDMNIPRAMYGFWFQDDWKLKPRLTFNLGVRYDLDNGVWDTSFKLASGVVKPRGGDNNNIAPRVGFAYDLFGDRRTVIRGGAGLYFADIQANQIIDQQIFNGERSIQASRDRTPTAPLNLLDPFNGATGADFVSGKLPVGPQAIQPVDSRATTPYSFQASLGAERQIGSNWTVAADWVHWRVYHEWLRFDANLFFDPATGFNKNPTVVGRPDTRFTTISQFQTPNAAGALYDGLHVDVRRRFAKGLTLSAAYTLSKVKDSSGGAFSTPNNFFDPADEWSLSGDNQRHTLNATGSYNMPWGFQFSTFYHYGSGSASAVSVAGSPFGAATTNRTFKDGTRVYNEAQFNLPSRVAPGYTVTKRNQFEGRPIHRVDSRISKSFTFKERWKATGIFEAFNLFNHSNFGSYATAVTSATYGAPTQNANLAYAARMLQVAARFEF